MYVYVIKCSIYYKIGFSKNPNNRLKTIKTHNPLDVKLVAKLKTDNYLELEKLLHNYFSNKNSKREWFELNEDDLIKLKIDYGFNFIVPIVDLCKTSVSNDYLLSEIKEVRIDNNKIDYFKNYFEKLFDVNIIDNNTIKRCCLKHDVSTIKKAIDSLFKQAMEGSKAYSILLKVCDNILESEENPSKYIVKIIKAIMYKRYNYIMDGQDIESLQNRYSYCGDVDDLVKELNTKKFYLNESEFWDYLYQNVLD